MDMKADMGTRAVKVQALFLMDSELKQRLKVKAAQEQKDMSAIVEELVGTYLKEHGDGNPNFAMEKWIDQADFRVTPAFFETPTKWYSYLQNCELKEIERIEGKAILITKQAKEQWYAKRRTSKSCQRIRI